MWPRTSVTSVAGSVAPAAISPSPKVATMAIALVQWMAMATAP